MMAHAQRASWARVASLALVFLAPVFATAPSRAFEVDLLSVGVRVRVGEQKVLGVQQPVSFRAYDTTATIRLPWQEPLSSHWLLGTRLLTSAGVLRGADKTAWLLSLIPLLALDMQDGRFTLDLGAGLALFGRHRYAEQDFGGPLQVALTLGVAVPLYERIAVGYRFMHYSDGGAYGRGSIGADFHMVELSYRF
jgi:hypothetical protein